MSFTFEDKPHYWINRLSFLLRKELARRFLLKGYDVSAEEWAVLMLLWHADGQTPSALADASVRDRTTMTRLVDGLVRKHFVHRKIDEADRRRSLIFLTPLGSDLQGELVPIANDFIQLSLNNVSAQEADLVVSVLRRITANLLDPEKSEET